MFSGGAVESLPKFCPNIFSDKSARIFLIFSSLCPNFHGFPKLGAGGGGQLPTPAPLSRTPMGLCSKGLVNHYSCFSKDRKEKTQSPKLSNEFKNNLSGANTSSVP